MKIRLGTRTSKLALAQANIAKEIIESKFGYDVEIIGEKSIGDRDQTTQLSRFRGQGVFTSHLERFLLNNQIDIAVHSLKDLPIKNNPSLDLRVFVKRNDPADTLIIKESKVLSMTPLQLASQTRIATGSPRRQSQILARFPSIIPIDIRGNVDTRIEKLNSSYVDGIVLSAAIFERINQDIPKRCVKIRLPLDDFPTTPGQGTIVIQVREGEFKEFEDIDHKITRTIVNSERQVQSTLGGGCELSLGLNISKVDNLWTLTASRSADDWNPSVSANLTRLMFEGYELNRLITKASELLQDHTPTLETNSLLENKTIFLTKGQLDGFNYINHLSKQGANVIAQELIRHETLYDKIWDEIVIESWLTSDWIVLTSQNAIEFLRLINSNHARDGYKIAVVGEKTAKSVRSIGLPVHLVADGNLKSLKEILKEARGSQPSKVLYLSGNVITGLPSPDANRIIVYKTSVQNVRETKNIDYTVVFSKKSAEMLIDQLGTNFTKTWVAIGNTTGEYLSSKRLNTKIAQSPTPQGVLRAIMEE